MWREELARTGGADTGVKHRESLEVTVRSVKEPGKAGIARLLDTSLDQSAGTLHEYANRIGQCDKGCQAGPGCLSTEAIE